jgi:YVTN family beta-propeller protein
MAGGELVKSFNIAVNAFVKSPNSNLIYATTTDDFVVVIDMDTLSISDTILVGSSPKGLAISRNGKTLYVAISGAKRIAEIDLATKSIGFIDLPFSPYDIEVGNGYLFATQNDFNVVGIMQVNLRNHEATVISDVEFSKYRHGGLLEISPDKNNLYVAKNDGTLKKFDISVNPPLLVSTLSRFSGATTDWSLTYDGLEIYLASEGDSISRFGASGFTNTGILATGFYPSSITSSPDGNLAYGSFNFGYIDVWDTKTLINITKYPILGIAYHLILDRTGQYLLAGLTNQLNIYIAENVTVVYHDTDQDNLDAVLDNCPNDFNPDQSDLDNDGIGDVCDSPDPIQFEIASYSVDESEGGIEIQVSRSSNKGEATVDYATSDGSATAGQDYSAISGTLIFIPGQTIASFTVPVLKDSLVEGDETLSLNLTHPGNGAILGSVSSAQISIRDANFAAADFFPLVPGSEWKYLANGLLSYSVKVPFESLLINNTATQVLKSQINNGKQYFSNDARGIMLHRLYVPNFNIPGYGKKNVTLTASPPIAFATEGAEIGQVFNSIGSFRVSVSGLGANTVPYSASYALLGNEFVSVPAGSFETVKLQGAIYIGGQFATPNTYYLAKGIGIVKMEADGNISELQSTNVAVRDLAITGINPPARVSLSAKRPSVVKMVKVSLQNRGPLLETIPDQATLQRLLQLNVESLGACPAPIAQILTKKLPVKLEPKQSLNVSFVVTFDCINDAKANTPQNLGHEDFRYTAAIDRSVLDGNADVHAADDVCPRSVKAPYQLDVYSGGNIRDFGCGTKKPDKTKGGPVMTDVLAPH